MASRVQKNKPITNIIDKHKQKLANTKLKKSDLKTLRIGKETRRDMNLRLLQADDDYDTVTFISKKNTNINSRQTVKDLSSALLQKPIKKPKCKNFAGPCKIEPEPIIDPFDLFIGWWSLATIDDWDTATLIHLFKDINGNPRAKFFDGTQTFPRELNANDEFSRNVPTCDGDECPVEVLQPRSLRFFNFIPVLSTDGLRSTMRIQDNDDNLAYVYLWSNWDGTSDDPQNGYVETLMQYRRLPSAPDNLQYNHLQSKIDWTNPVNMFEYIRDYWQYLAQPQKAYILNQVNYIGSPEYNALFKKFLDTGLHRIAKTSQVFRGGKYIGVWKTQFPQDYPFTTIHTQEVHHFNMCSTLNITGFKGAYSILNGTHNAATNPPSALSVSTPYPWQDCDSRQPFIYVDVDTSAITEDYNPNIHGVGILQAQHGPITPDIGYRDFVAAIIDFGVSSFGPGTHTRVRVWYNPDTNKVPETFVDLKQGISENKLRLLTMRFRTYQSNSFQLYWNPVVINGTLSFPTFNLNDPFGLGLSDFDPYFDFDIALNNYLDKNRTYNMFFAITGPVLPEEPITGQLVDIGYQNNGSQITWTVNSWGIIPPPLVDQYGTHTYRYYAAADGDPGTEEFAAYAYFGGIISPEYTGGKTVAYIRVQSCDGVDAPFYEFTTRPLVFGPANFPSKASGLWTAAWSSLIRQLNQFNPDRYIIDSRNNAGGFAQMPIGFAALFGGDRDGDTKFIAYAGNGYANPLLLDSSIEKTVFDALAGDTGKVQASAAETAFPGGTVRARSKTIELVFLDSSHAASGGDEIAHYFIGPDPNSKIHDLGAGVISRFIGDIDGRLWSGIKSYDGLALDPINHNLRTADGEPRTALYLAGEAGELLNDRHGSIVNEQTWTQPAILLPGWFDDTEWQDIGVTQVKLPYPLGNTKSNPTFNQRESWRDVWLEYAIAK